MSEEAMSRKQSGIGVARTIQTLVGLVGALAALVRFTDGCSQKPLGSQAERPEDCRSGLLLREPGSAEGICSRKCDADFDCGDLRCLDSHCAPRGTLKAGESCAHAWECASGTCGSPFANPLEATSSVCGW